METFAFYFVILRYELHYKKFRVYNAYCIDTICFIHLINNKKTTHMKTENKKLAGSVNLTPSWQAATNIYIAALQHGNDEGRNLARDGLLQCANVAQSFVDAKEIFESMKRTAPNTKLTPDMVLTIIQNCLTTKKG